MEEKVISKSKKSIDDFVRNFLSTKVIAFIIATILFIKGYLSEELWFACYGLFFGVNYLQKRLFHNNKTINIEE
jgi:hypothetical protein